MMKYYNHMVLYNDIDKGIGIVTGWNMPQRIKNDLDDDNIDKVSSIGTLYTKNGINYIIGNLFLNPQITHLILIEDSNPDFSMSDSIKGFIEFLNTGDINFQKRLNFGDEDIKVFQQYFKDHYSVVKRKDLNDLIRSLDIKDRWIDETKEFEEESKHESMESPSEKIGAIVRGNTVKEVWLKAVKFVATYGYLKESAYDEYQKEFINLGMIVLNEDINNPSMVGELGITYEELDRYMKSLINGMAPDGVAYTYGNRFRNFNEIDQLEYVKKVLQESSYTRRAVATLWNPELDSKQEEVPCIDLYQALIQDNKLYMTAYLRANDIVNGFPRNIYGVLNIQDILCKELNLDKGPVEIIACSAHIYSRDFNDLDRFLNANISNCEEDPRGYFVVDVKDDHIEVALYAKDGSLINIFNGISASELRKECCYYISNVDHAFYLGQELEKAEIALKNKLMYIQDRKLILEQK